MVWVRCSWSTSWCDEVVNWWNFENQSETGKCISNTTRRQKQRGSSVQFSSVLFCSILMMMTKMNYVPRSAKFLFLFFLSLFFWSNFIFFSLTAPNIFNSSIVVWADGFRPYIDSKYYYFLFFINIFFLLI